MTEHTTDWKDVKYLIKTNLWGYCCKDCEGGGGTPDICDKCRGTGIVDWQLEPLLELLKNRFLPKQVVEEAIGEDEPTSDWEMDFERGRNDLRRKLRNTLGLGETHNE